MTGSSVRNPQIEVKEIMITTAAFPAPALCFLCITTGVSYNRASETETQVYDFVESGVPLTSNQRHEASLIILQTGPNEFYVYKDRQGWEHQCTGNSRQTLDLNLAMQVFQAALSDLRRWSKE